MSRKLIVALSLLALISLSGCLTKPVALLETAATEIIHPDGALTTFFAYGPWSDEFDQAWDHMQAHHRTYQNDLDSIVDDYDKHFLSYDKYDPFAE